VPAWTLEHGFLSLSLGHWIVLVILLLGTFTLLALFGAACNLLARKIVADPVRRGAWDAWYRATRWPAIVALTIIIQFTVIPSQSLMLLTERMLNAAIVVIAIIAVLILLGVESKTALAALGVVGVALALGAQKTVENLLGGIFLLSDRALAVGDYCTIANQSGVVEDVTLRSVRLRTTNQSLVSLPAGSLAQTGIENFASRTKMPVISTLRLRYGTSAAQLKRILAEVRTLLETNPMFETGTSFIGLVNFGPEAIELELFAFVLTNDGDRFRIVREELLLEIAARVDAAGSGLAPTRFVQMQPGADGTVLSQAAAGSAAATREH
jgi:MscS family membrane protein